MSEGINEEKVIDRGMMIGQWKVSGDVYTQDELDAIGSLLDLYQKEKEKNKKLEARKYMFNAETGEITAIPTDNNYISKDKIREKLLEPIRKEGDEINKKFFKKDKGFEVEGAILQELGAIEGMILNLLEENNGKND